MKKLLSLLLVITLMGCASVKNEYEGIDGKANVKQISEDAVLEMFESGTGLLLFSFPESEWCQKLMPVLNQMAIVNEQEVSYFNVRDIRQSETDEYSLMYKEIIEYLESTEFDTLTYEKIYVPTILKFENGEIIDFHLGTVVSHVETSAGLPDLSNLEVLELKGDLNRLFR